MRLASRALLAAAERAAMAGPRPALLVWRKLAATSDDAELVARSVLAGLAIAVDVRDRRAAAELATAWRRAGDAPEEDAFTHLQRLWAIGFRDEARALAASEVARRPSARACYTLARSLPESDERVPTLYQECIDRSAQEGHVELGRAARVMRSVLRFNIAFTREAAIAEALAVDTADATPAEKLALGKVLLASPSRFGRARALGLLDDVVIAGSSAQQRRALLLAARHVDRLGVHLSPLEADRARALLSREAVAPTTILARSLLDVVTKPMDDPALEAVARGFPDLAEQHARVRDLVSGRFEAHHARRQGVDRTFADVLLDAAFAWRDGAWSLAATHLHRLALLAERERFIPSNVWAMTIPSLSSTVVEVRSAGVALVRALAQRGEATAVPPTGYRSLANVLEALGEEELAIDVARLAHGLREAGSGSALGELLRRSVYRRLSSPTDVTALERLREARDLLRGAST